jgi:hypothetical protein
VTQIPLKSSLTLQIELIEKHAAEQSPKRIEELVKIFIRATNVRQRLRMVDLLANEWIPSLRLGSGRWDSSKTNCQEVVH